MITSSPTISTILITTTIQWLKFIFSLLTTTTQQQHNTKRSQRKKERKKWINTIHNVLLLDRGRGQAPPFFHYGSISSKRLKAKEREFFLLFWDNWLPFHFLPHLARDSFSPPLPFSGAKVHVRHYHSEKKVSFSIQGCHLAFKKRSFPFLVTLK